MIPPEQFKPDWTAIGVIGGFIINIAGWFVVHFLTKERERQRDVEARMRDSNLATSDFEATVRKWLDLVEDRQQIALTGIHAKSMPEIEQSIRLVRHHLNTTAKSRLHDEWYKYQHIDRKQLEGFLSRHPESGLTITVYDDARKVLSDPLKKMLEITHPSGAFGPDDIPPPRPRDPNDPIDYDSLNLRPEDM